MMKIPSTKLAKTLTTFAAVAALGLAAIAMPQPAQARGGGAVAAGIIGGLAAGAIIGGIASQGYYGPGYGGGPAYGAYGAGPVYYGPRCYWSRQRVWDGWNWHWQRVRACN